MQAEQWVRDHDGVMVRLTKARRQIRLAFGDPTDQQLAANAQGRIHPDQQQRAASHRHRQIAMAWFLAGVPAVVVALVAVAAAAAWPHYRGWSGALGALVGAALLAWGWASAARIRRARVETVRGIVAGDARRAGGPTLLAGIAIPVDEHWIGMPIVVHLIRPGVTGPLLLSGDLEVDRVETLPRPAKRAPGDGPPATVGGTGPSGALGPVIVPTTRVARQAAWAAFSAAFVTAALLGGGRHLAFAMWALAFGVALPFQIIETIKAWRESRRRYQLVRDDSEQIMIVVTEPDGRSRGYPVGAITKVRHQGALGGANTSWTFQVAGEVLVLSGGAGRELLRQVRAHRPGLVAVRDFYDASGGS